MHMRHIPYFPFLMVSALIWLLPFFWLCPPVLAAEEGQPHGLVQSPAYEEARRLATLPYETPVSQPDFLRELSGEKWNSLRFKPEQALWSREGLPFTVNFYHPGFLYDRGVRIQVLENSRSVPIEFSSDMFFYPDANLADQVREHPLSFAGFSVHAFKNSPTAASDAEKKLVSFLGATLFRSSGKHSRPGLHARGLALNTASSEGEEFPWFREFWLTKPLPGETSFTLYALLDSPSMTGAFRFVVTPGTSTVMDVECRLFLRSNATLPRKIGLAPLNSMFLFSETAPWSDKDYRPEVHKSDGLLFEAQDGSWCWNPLSNPTRLAVSDVSLPSPRGFGLMQRDTRFDHYQDIEARFEQHPSLWVEPKGDWGSGKLELIEIPSTDPIHDNIAAFWFPEAPEMLFKDGEASFAYRLYWMDPGVTPHGLGRAVSTRMVRPQKNDVVRFVVDFEGQTLAELPADTGLTSEILTPEDVPLLYKTLIKNPVTGGWRLDFSIRLPKQEGVMQSLISAREGAPRLRISALLKKGENIPEPLTETWTFTLPH